MSTEGPLPSSWVDTTLNDVCELNPRTGFESVSASQLVSFIPMVAVAEESGILDSSDERPFSAVSKGYTRFCEGDVLFAKITPCMENGKSAVARGLKNGVGCGTTEFHVLRPLEGVDPDYVRYFLLQRSFRREAERNMRGAAGQRRVPSTYLESRRLPIAPSNEQRRIVDKIDELFSDIEEGERALERARKLLDRCRQAVLKAAVSGELTKDWRESHKGEIESGEALLTRILKSGREAWEQAELAKMCAKGPEPKDDRWKERYEEPVRPSATDGPPLPKCWTWATCGMVSAIVGGVTVDAKKQDAKYESIPYLRVANVQRGWIDLSEVKEIRVSAEKIRSLLLKPGDVLLNEGGDRDKVGRGWVWDGQIERCIHQNHVFRARLFCDELPPKFVSYYANEAGRDYFFTQGKQTTNLASISLSKITQLPIPIPPAAEAKLIVEVCEDALSVFDRASADIGILTDKVAALRQSILTAAFSGKLVPQDPSDEPASVLLDRIRAERAAAGKPPGKRRGRPAGKVGKSANELELPLG